MAGRWAILASNVRSPGDGGTSGRLVDVESGRAPIELADALLRTIERVRTSGAQVIVVGPVPEVDFNVPPTLVRSLQGIGRMPVVRRADFGRISCCEPWPRLRRVASPPSSTRTRSCAIAICAVADGIRSLYLDDDHLSPFGSARVSALIKSVIADAQRSQARPAATITAAPAN